MMLRDAFDYNSYVFAIVGLNYLIRIYIKRQFYTDVVNAVAFSTPVSYLSKYGDIENYETVVETE